MKIEVGKFYKTRGLGKARIYATDGKIPFCIHGATFIENDWQTLSWNIDGTYWITADSPYDIVAEWVEPKPKMLAFRSQASGIIYMFSGEYDTPETAFGYTRMPHLDPPEDK